MENDEESDDEEPDFSDLLHHTSNGDIDKALAVVNDAMNRGDESITQASKAQVVLAGPLRDEL